MKAHHAVMLDEATFTSGDLDLFALVNQVDRWDRYTETANVQRFEHLKNAIIVVTNKVAENLQAWLKGGPVNVVD